VGVGLNVSSVALRVIGGDKNETECTGVKLVHPIPGVVGGLESEDIKYGHEFREIRTGE
jgi:hypothetical protein